MHGLDVKQYIKVYSEQAEMLVYVWRARAADV